MSEMPSLIESISALLLLIQTIIMIKHYARTQIYQELMTHKVSEMRKMLAALKDRNF